MKRILIVDDRDDNRYYLRALLEGHGYAVDQAAQGLDALNVARDNPPDIVISDLLMPVMDGYTLLRAWKTDESLANIPFIVHTATYTDESDERLAMHLGAAAFIRKPCDTESFISVVKAVHTAPPGPGRPGATTVDDEKIVLERYNSILIRKLEKRSEQLELANRTMSRELAERRRMQEDMRQKNMLLATQQEASLDAILVVGGNDKILSVNRRFVELWGVSREVGRDWRESAAFRSAVSQVENPDAVLRRIEYLHGNSEERSHDELALRDGRIIDCYSSPITGSNGSYHGRIWFFRDISQRKQYERQLQEKNQFLRQVSAMAHVGGWAFIPDTGEGTWTEEIARIHDVSLSIMPSVSYSLDFYPGESRKLIERAVREAVDDGMPYDLELEFISAAGTHKWVRTIGEPVIRDGKVVEVRGAMQDISEQKANEQRIKRLNRVLAILSHINMLIVRVKSRQELYTESCRIAIEVGGLSMAMIAVVDEAQDRIVPVASMGKSPDLMDKISNILSSANKRKTMVARALATKEPMVSNDAWRDPQVVFREDYIECGVHSMAVLPLVVSGRAIAIFALYAKEPQFFHDEEMGLLIELANDIAFAIDHINKQERIEYLSFYDDLTELANQRLFLDRVTQNIRAAQHGERKLAVVLVDLERFKSINDSLGKSAGDSLLKQVAGWFTREFGDANLVARINADHFALVVTEVEPKERLERELAGKFKALMERPFLLQKEAVYRIGVKAGVALYPEHGPNAGTLFNKAEVALKTSQAKGERFLFYSREMDEKVAVKLSMENQLRLAIDNEEFVLHYQPKIHVVSGLLTGAEALIRWNKPEVGLVPPNEFIPLLEETGLIYEVGRWAMRKAVSDYLRWCSVSRRAVRISVNVSSLQLRKPDFIKDVERQAGIDERAAAGLELELTESSVMENINANIDTLQAIRSLGIQVSIDDFGTGFSSLSYLSKLPLDALKIDREFVLAMTNGPEGLALVSTIINLAHSLNLKVVAEGVETQEQLRLLARLGCDEMQGFLVDSALPAEAFESKYLAAGRGS